MNQSGSVSLTNNRANTSQMTPDISIDYADYYKGLALALSSCVFIGTSFIVKKKGLLKVASSTSSSRAGDGGFAYLKEWMWWAGLFTMVVGEAANFAAYAFAPAILVTPLGAISVLISAVLASVMLKERLNLLGKIGCFLCVVGSVVLVIHAPPEENVSSMDELSAKLRDPLFISYTCIALIGTAILIFHVAPKHGRNVVFVYVGICSVIGSLTVAATKGVALALKETLEGNSQLTNPVAWMLLIGGTLCIGVQMNYLNKALDIFNTAIVTPVYYVKFTTCTLLASAILFKEWAQLNAKDSLGSVCGFLTIILGVFLLHAFRDIKFSLRDLYGSVASSSSLGVNKRHQPLLNGETNVLLSSLTYDEQVDEDDIGDVELSDDSSSDELFNLTKKFKSKGKSDTLNTCF